jgi:hypothetical protein
VSNKDEILGEVILDMLSQFLCLPPSDQAKTDLEVICLTCGTHLCDVEAGNDLGDLAATAACHEHNFRQLEYWSAGKAVAGWDPVTGAVTLSGGEQAGIAVSANGARMVVQEALGYPTDVTWRPVQPAGSSPSEDG